MDKSKSMDPYFWSGPLKFDVFMDACAFYPPVKKEKEACSQIIRLVKEGKIQLQITELTERELNRAPQKVKRIIEELCLIITPFSAIKRRDYEEVKRNIFPGKTKLRGGDDIDIKNLFTAHKGNADFFVTYNPKHFDKNSQPQYIERKFGFKIVTPSQCLKKLIDEHKKAKMHQRRMRELRGW